MVFVRLFLGEKEQFFGRDRFEVKGQLWGHSAPPVPCSYVLEWPSLAVAV